MALESLPPNGRSPRTKKNQSPRSSNEPVPFRQSREYMRAAAACAGPYQPPAPAVYPPPEIFCVYCLEPVAFYEKQDPPTCLWCEKMIADVVLVRFNP